APQDAPVLVGDLEFKLDDGARLELSGLLIDGSITVHGRGTLVLEHSTLAPRPDSLQIHGPPSVTILYAVVGGIVAEGDGPISLTASIVDGAIDTHGSLELRRVTALGPVRATEKLNAEDSILAKGATAGDGLIRTSCVPDRPGTPKRLNCV